MSEPKKVEFATFGDFRKLEREREEQERRERAERTRSAATSTPSASPAPDASLAPIAGPSPDTGPVQDASPSPRASQARSASRTVDAGPTREARARSASPAKRQSSGRQNAGPVPGASPAYPAAPDVIREFQKIPNQIADDLFPTIDVYAQAVYTQLFRLSYGHGRTDAPVSRRRLAERCFCSETSVRDAIKVLEKRGLIERIGYKFGGAEQYSVFRVFLPDSVPAENLGLARGTSPTRQTGPAPHASPAPGAAMKEISERHVERAPGAVAPAIDVFGIRTIAARLFEAHRGEPGFDRERLRSLVEAALVGQGTAPDHELVDEAIKGMAE